MSFTVVARKTYLILLIVLLEMNIYVTKGLGAEKFTDLELEQQLKILNKPYVKSFKIGDNDFDCVDIYQQPAFSHPLLKGHKIQMNPSEIPIIPTMDRDKSANKGSSDVGNTDQTCPEGTVPIRRTRKRDLIIDQMMMMKNSTQYYKYKYHVALAALQNTGPYYGAYALINIQSPTVSDNSEYSQAFMLLQATKGDEVNYIQAGWMVNEALYNDTQPRLYVSWAMFKGGKNIGGCTNTMCPGFVQTQSSTKLGMPLTSSTYGGDQQEQSFLLYKYRYDGNWWLSYGANNEQVGYWPSSLFTALKDSADFVGWGGEVFARTDLASPGMGSGHFAKEGYKKAAYINSLVYLDSQFETNRNHIVKWDQLKLNVTTPNCYTLTSYGSNGFFYGGPGGPNC